MRAIIKFAAGLFVVLGVILLLAYILAVQEILGDSAAPAFVPIAALAAVPAVSSIILIGGGTYLVARIDERLEQLVRIQERTLQGPHGTVRVAEPEFAQGPSAEPQPHTAARSTVDDATAELNASSPAITWLIVVLGILIVILIGGMFAASSVP